ncbi:cation transporter [Nonomuraea turcica]|uniref:cation transporter n=1 Tax=Nonomuraea sp. G32 TaxID=3067274 RepID=UPI00273B44C4|nr:cation transporter [Nonomuraea sp. G32]MDP4505397.1 cation transporter [Nonomuraea sp. G32]
MDAGRRFLGGALALIVAFMAIEVVIGVIAQSLALISDAGHRLTDAVAIVFALIAAKPPQGGFTTGSSVRRSSQLRSTASRCCS